MLTWGLLDTVASSNAFSQRMTKMTVISTRSQLVIYNILVVFPHRDKLCQKVKPQSSSSSVRLMPFSLFFYTMSFLLFILLEMLQLQKHYGISESQRRRRRLVTVSCVYFTDLLYLSCNDEKSFSTLELEWRAGQSTCPADHFSPPLLSFHDIIKCCVKHRSGLVSINCQNGSLTQNTFATSDIYLMTWRSLSYKLQMSLVAVKFI